MLKYQSIRAKSADAGLIPSAAVLRASTSLDANRGSRRQQDAGGLRNYGWHKKPVPAGCFNDKKLLGVRELPKSCNCPNTA
jgi:hypothetical protein